MNCHDFETRFERLVDGDLQEADRRACLQHAEQCTACGELLTGIGEAEVAAAAETAEPLVDSILSRTIGTVCKQAEKRLPAFVDQDLSAGDQELLKMHLGGCAHCRQMVTTLRLLEHQLPQLAETPVDEKFTAQVLAATLPLPMRLKRWLRSQATSWVRRPRFAMEAAYVGLLVVMLVMGAFSAPLAALPQKGIEWVQPDPETPTVWNRANEGLGTFWEKVASLFEKVEKDKKTERESP